MRVRKLSAYQVRENLWRCYGLEPITHRRKPYYGNTKLEAEEKARASFNDLVPSKNLTFAAYYFDFYLPTIVHKSENWQLVVSWAFDNYLVPNFGECLLNEITRIQIQRFFNLMAGKLNASSLSKIRVCLSALLNLAVTDGVLAVSPCIRIELPIQRQKTVEILSFTEMADLFYIGDGLVKSFILIQFAGGLRIAECCGLRLDDLSPSGKLSVQRQVLQLPGGSILSENLKTVSTRRVLTLPNELCEMLRHYAFGSEFFLGSKRGSFGLPNNVSRSLDIARNKLGLRKIPCHLFRHSVISHLLLMGAPDAVVKRIAGKSTRTGDALAVYSHANDAEIEKWIGIIFGEFLVQLNAKSGCTTSMCSKTMEHIE